MRFLKRDMTSFSLYKSTYTMCNDGDGQNINDEPPAAEFYGHIQPYRESRSQEEYGIELQYTYVVYVAEDKGFCEGNRIFDGTRRYEIEVIQRWRDHLRLTVREVRE